MNEREVVGRICPFFTKSRVKFASELRVYEKKQIYPYSYIVLVLNGG